MYSTRAARTTWSPTPGVDHTPYHASLDAMYAALGNATRRRILHCIGNGMTGPALLSEYVGVAPQTVCHHVRVLKVAGLVHLCPVNGRLSVNRGALAALRDHMQRHF